MLLTGAAGLLGTWLRRTAPATASVVPLLRQRPLAGAAGAAEAGPTVVRADLRDAAATAEALAAVRPDVVIHAAYSTDETSIVAATQHLAEAAVAVGARLVHISTDAVFSGDGTPRAEGDRPDPVADYGRWKARAEEIACASDRAVVIRLPLIVSLDPDDHAVATIRRGAAAGTPSPWFDDEVRQPALAADLAPAIWAIAALDPAAAAGAWHLPGPERLTRLAIAQRVVAALDLDPSAITGGPTPPGLARPRDLHLLAERARTAIGWSPRPVLAP